MYKQAFTPSQWLHLPRTYEICQFSPFAAVIDLPSDAVVTEANFEEPMQILPERLSKYWDKKKASRLQMIFPQVELDSPSSMSGTEALDLATSVFRCREYSPFGTIVVGVERHLTHTCISPGHGLPGASYGLSGSSNEKNVGECLSFSEQGSTTARALVGLVGLDPNTTTASDMDNCTVRFSCTSCPIRELVDGSMMRVGYSWRSAVGFSLSFDILLVCHEADCILSLRFYIHFGTMILCFQNSGLLSLSPTPPQ